MRRGSQGGKVGTDSGEGGKVGTDSGEGGKVGTDNEERKPGRKGRY